jgi:hypothetical protein
MTQKSELEEQRHPVTVVIPTLGGDTLRGTIECLNQGSVAPDEILVCIPAADAHRVVDFSFPNVKAVITDCRGQVAQRAVGFRVATCEIVMQLDDDILVDEHCIENLRAKIVQRPNAVVGPSMGCKGMISFPYERKTRTAFFRLYFWLLAGSSGYEYGRITRAGTEIGTAFRDADGEVFEVDWLPGGCVMHHRENLIEEDFYPFEGKAFCEDLYHSHFLKKKGVDLLVEPRAVCWFEPVPATDFGLRDFFRDLRCDHRARRHFVRLTSRSLVRMHLHYLAVSVGYLYKKACRKAG